MATLAYAYADGIAWLEPLASEAHPMVHDLCRLHAAKVRVPLGWELRDEWTATGGSTGTTRPEQSSIDLIGA